MTKWQPLGLGGFGHMLTPAMGPSFGDFPYMMLNCDMGGVYVSIDDAKTWTLLHHNQLQSSTICKPLFHPDGESVFAASGNSRLKICTNLNDAPETWHWEYTDEIQLEDGNVADGFPERLCGEIALDHDTGLMFVATTTNYSWQGYGFIGGRQNCSGISLNEDYRNPTDPDYEPYVSHIWRSEDKGFSWTLTNAPDDLGFVLGFHIDQRDPGQTAATKRCYAATQKAILVSDDGGQNWSPLSSAGLPVTSGRLIRSFSAGSKPDPDGGGELRMYASLSNTPDGTSVGLFRRIGDDDWEPCPTKGIDVDVQCAQGGVCERVQFHHLLTSDHSPNLIHASHVGTGYVEPLQTGIYQSTNGGDSWCQIVFSDPRMPHCNLPPDWESSRTHEGVFESAAGFANCTDDPHRLLVTGTRAYVRDGDGVNWRAADSQIPDPNPQGTGHPALGWTCNGLVVTAAWKYVIDPHKPSRHYIAYTDIGFARSLDSGKTWIWGGTRKIEWFNTVYDFLIDPEKPGRMWAAFSAIHDIPNGNVVLFWQGELTEEEKQGRVGLSDDFGQTWTYLEDGIPPKPVTCLARTENGDLYAGVWEKGVYRLPKSSKTWEPFNEGFESLQNKRVWQLQVHRNGSLLALITANTKPTRNGADFQSVNEGVGLYRFDSGTARWTRLGQGGIQGSTSQRFDWPRGFATGNDGEIYIAATEPIEIAASIDPISGLPQPAPDQAGIYRLRTADDVWEPLESPKARNRYRYFGVFLHPTQPDWIYVTLEGEPGLNRAAGGLWLSKDRGKTFEAFTDFPFKHVHRVFVDVDEHSDRSDSQDDEALYVVTNGASVWRGPTTPNRS